VTVVPETLPVRPRTAVALIVPVAVQLPLTNEYFRIRLFVSSVKYSVSTPGGLALRSARKKP
jgi:hypothetical protein